MSRLSSILQTLRTIRSAYAFALAVVAPAVMMTSAIQAQTLSLDNVPAIALSSSSSVSAVSIDPQSGSVIVRSQAGTLNTCSGPAAQVPTINSFTTNLSTVTPGSTITLSWNSSNTTSCTPQQGSGTLWPSLGTLGVSGAQSIAVPSTAGIVAFQLTCTNGASSDSRTVQVNVQSGGGGGSCPPLFAGSGSSTWAGTFNTWPAYGVRKRLTVPLNAYLAFSFTATGVAGQFGSVVTSDYPGDGDGHGQMSISRDPGCFDQAFLGPRCLSTVSRFVSIGWANGAAQFACSLTPGQQYYVNITYGGTTVAGPAAFCPAGICGADIQNQPQD